jgi:hypothetical protein
MSSSGAVLYVPRNQRKRSRLDQQQQPPFIAEPSAAPAAVTVASSRAASAGLRYSNKDNDDNDNDNETTGRQVVVAATIRLPPGSAAATIEQQQRPEDFMDDQDHNEWGGPVRVKQHFGGGSGISGISGTTKPSASTIADGSNILDSIFGGDKKNHHHEDNDVRVNPKDANIGNRLLHRLGWRGQGVSFVPNNDEEHSSHYATRNNHIDNHNNNLEQEEQIFLSQRRLRKILVQQERVRIPPPKTDHAGLGYQALDNAPEFRAHREQRQRLALARQQQQQQSDSGSNSVYRLSNLLVDKNNNSNKTIMKPPPLPRTAASGSDGNGNTNQSDHLSLSYETIQDFVGTKSVSGFALRDDDDDAVFDDPAVASTGAQAQHDGGEEALDTVAYEHTLSDVDEEDDEHGNLIRDREAQALGGALAAFANLNDDAKNLPGEKGDINLQNNSSSISAIGHVGEQRTSHASLLRTADGRPPLPGFVIGIQGQQQLHFYRGPDVPDLYEVKPHEFHANDHPLVYQALSRAMQLEAQDVRQLAATRAALESNAAAVVPKRKSGSSSTTASTATTSTATKTPDSTLPMAGSAFAGLQEAMKIRFVSSSGTTTKTASVDEALAGESFSGLVTHAALTLSKNPAQQQQQSSLSKSAAVAEPEKKVLVVKRTIMSFVPEPLVCKRFHVSPPPQSTFERQQHKHRQQGAEDSYFHDSILKTAQEQRHIVVKGSGKIVEKPEGDDEEEDALVIHQPSRPSMQIYKSIFAPESESESSDESDNEVDPVKPDNNDDEKNEETQLAAAASVREKNVLNDPSFGIDDSKDSRALVVASHGESAPPRKRTWSSDSSNLSSSSPDESNKNSDDGGEKRRRRDKKSSHRKLHGKSHNEKKKSRKHSRKRKNTEDLRRSRKKRYHSNDDDDDSFDSNGKQEDLDDHRRRRKDSKKKSRRKECKSKSKSSRRESSSPHPSERRHRDRT